jgi:hypothetical protein
LFGFFPFISRMLAITLLFKLTVSQRTIKQCLAWNQDNVSERSDVSTCGLLVQPPNPIDIELTWLICWVFNATYSNISALSWRPVLAVEEAGIPGETTDHGQETGKLYHLRLRVECTLFCNLQSRARTHAVLVIGLYELLGNPTTYLIEPPGSLELTVFNLLH